MSQAATQPLATRTLHLARRATDPLHAQYNGLTVMRRSWAGRSAKVAKLGVKVAGIQGNAPAADAELLPTSDLYLNMQRNSVGRGRRVGAGF